MTPAYFETLMKRHERNVEREEHGRNLMLAQLTAMVANTGFARFEKVRNWQEFMPVRPEAVKKPRRPTQRQLSNKLERFFMDMMERQKRRP